MSEWNYETKPCACHPQTCNCIGYKPLNTKRMRNLTPEEKAKELVAHFSYPSGFGKAYFIGRNNAKQCALICVDEKQKTIDKMFNGYYTMPEEWQKEWDYLEQVKQEIEKL